MKRKNDYKLMKVGVQNIVVRETEDGEEPSGMIWLNGTGVFLWEQLADEISVEELTKRLADKYSIAPEAVRGDVDAFLNQLKDGEALEGYDD